MKNKPYLQKNTAEDSMHKKSIPTFYLNLKKEIQDVEQKKPIKVQQWLKENAIKDNRSYFTGYNKNGVPTFHLKIDPKKAREDYLKQIDEAVNQHDEKENFGTRVKNNDTEIKIINAILDKDYSANNSYKPKSQVNQIKFQQFSPNCFGKTKS